MKQDEELHAALMQAFSRYFRENQEWINKGTRRSAIRLRRYLSEIRELCSQRREHIREWRHELDDIKAQKKAIQKAQGNQDTTAN